MPKSVRSAYSRPAAPAAGAINYSAPDLGRFPPRSPRTRLGGFNHLPRLIDKARASLAGTSGDYHYNCSMDQHFWQFTGLKPAAFLQQVKSGKSDAQLLAYVLARSQPKRTASEIAAWSAWFESRPPLAVEGRAFFNDVHRKNAPHREDIATWFDWLELDDFVSFGGQP